MAVKWWEPLAVKSAEPAHCEFESIGFSGLYRCRFCGWETKHARDRAPRRNCGQAPRSSAYADGYRSEQELDRLIDQFCRPCASFPYSELDATTGRFRIKQMCAEQSPCQRAATADQWRARLRNARVRCPLGRWNEHIDVLYGINPRNQEWVESKAAVPVALLNDTGISAVTCAVYGVKFEELCHALRRNRPRMLVNCAMFIGVELLDQLAVEFPDVQFVTSCHSSQSDLARIPSWLKRQFAYLELARRRPNCWYALVDERVADFGRAIGCPRLIHLNNCVPLPAAEPTGLAHEPPVVSLICEFRPLKNIPNQLLAAAIVNERLPLRLLLAIKSDPESLALKYAHGLGLDVDLRPWQTWREYRRMIAEEITVGLQASFTESFNFVALDHLQVGRPVIGSPAVRFLPRHWQGNPDDPRDLAKRLVHVLNHYRRASRWAVKAARRKAEASNAAFLGTVRSILNAS